MASSIVESAGVAQLSVAVTVLVPAAACVHNACRCVRRDEVDSSCAPTAGTFHVAPVRTVAVPLMNNGAVDRAGVLGKNRRQIPWFSRVS
jgi:hypothetical protein